MMIKAPPLTGPHHHHHHRMPHWHNCNSHGKLARIGPQRLVSMADDEDDDDDEGDEDLGREGTTVPRLP